MARQRENLGINDGFEVWINQILQDNLTGAEFDKLAKSTSNLSKEDFLPNQGLNTALNMVQMWNLDKNSKPNKPNISKEDKQELISLEQKAREILIDEAGRLDFDSFKNLLQCAHINKNSNNIANVKLQNEIDETKRGFFLYKETDNQAESKEESSEEVEYKIGGNLLEALRQNLTGRDFREFSECVENGTPSYDLFDKAKEILIKCLESYPILIAISKGNFGGASIGDSLKNVSK